MDGRRGQTCILYYIFTILYMLFMPIVIIFHIDKIEGKLLHSTTIFIIYDIIEYLVPLIVAFAMFLYAYLCIGKFKLNKPDSMLGLYLPVFGYLGWQLYLSVSCTLFADKTPSYYALLSLNLYGWLMSLDWRSVMLFNWIYNLFLLGGFAAGERLAFRKTEVVRRPFRIKYIWLVLICSAVMLLICEGASFYKRRNFIEWMTGPQGQQIVSDTGYVALQNP